MGTKPETNFTRRITNRLPKSIYHMKNNNPYTGGVPDLWFSGNGGDLWCEMKYIDPLPVNVPVRPTKLLSALQLDWLNKRHAEGRNVAVIIGCKAGGVILTHRKWEQDIPINDYNSLIRSPNDLAAWIEGQVTK